MNRTAKVLLALLPVALVAGVGAATLRPADLPPPPADAQSGRVLPAAAPLVTGQHAFLFQHPDGSPVVPDPCRPMHWVLNATNMPAGADTEVREAFQFLSKATGLQFIEDGASDERPAEQRDAVQSQRYGDRFAPVLVSFEDSGSLDFLGGDVAAVAIPDTISTTGRDSERIVTGQVIVDTDFTASALRSGDGRSRMRMVLMHELGHLVGLGHVEDANEVMSPVADGFLYYGAGDQQGLAKAGSGRCFADA